MEKKRFVNTFVWLVLNDKKPAKEKEGKIG